MSKPRSGFGVTEYGPSGMLDVNDPLCGVPGIPRGTIEDYARLMHPEWFPLSSPAVWADWLRTQRHDAALAAELAERAEMLGLEP